MKKNIKTRTKITKLVLIFNFDLFRMPKNLFSFVPLKDFILQMKKENSRIQSIDISFDHDEKKVLTIDMMDGGFLFRNAWVYEIEEHN